ncbi:fulicin peptides-like isoform X1 [Centruroides sculpturatus]|uniref:fulicin peptides-like isoform X1 n=1 Tax=Centruroides sculpturatus TaxID=218467 RepID=UPI000C6DF21D|nr:fulicin peptides-like isoform X1 [Centruroides sculpturatus]
MSKMLEVTYSRQIVLMAVIMVMSCVSVLSVSEPEQAMSNRGWSVGREFPSDVARKIFELVRVGTGMNIPDVNSHETSLKRSRYSQREIGSEFLGKRTVDDERDKRIGSEFLGKRMGSEFLGKRIGSEFLGKRMGSEFLGKRMGSEFLGKRIGSEFLGKRADVMYNDQGKSSPIGSEFLGRRKRDVTEKDLHQRSSVERV